MKIFFKKLKIVSFLGCDGAGKTSLIKKLELELKNLNKNCKIYHFRPFLNENYHNSKPITNPNSQIPWPRSISLLKIFYLSIIYNVFFYFYAPIFLSKFDLIIFDRYFYDLAVNQRRYRLNLSKQFIFKLFKFIPIPNISFFINTSYDECLLRSDDILNKEIISKEIKNLKNLKKYCNNFHEINGNKDIKDVFIEVVGKLEKANLVKLNN